MKRVTFHKSESVSETKNEVDNITLGGDSADVTSQTYSYKSKNSKYDVITESLKDVSTTKEFEFLGVSRKALQKINKPLADTFQKYILHMKCGVPTIDENDTYNPAKYYQAQAYTIMADSMDLLDENKQSDWQFLEMYISLLSRFECLEEYSEIMK